MTNFIAAFLGSIIGFYVFNKTNTNTRLVLGMIIIGIALLIYVLTIG